MLCLPMARAAALPNGMASLISCVLDYCKTLERTGNGALRSRILFRVFLEPLQHW